LGIGIKDALCAAARQHTANAANTIRKILMSVLGKVAKIVKCLRARGSRYR